MVISKTDQSKPVESEELKSSLMVVVVEGPGEKDPPMEEWSGIGDPSFTSGLPEMKPE